MRAARSGGRAALLIRFTMKRAPSCLAALATVVACREQRSVTSPPAIAADLSNGSVAAGNGHFFFLPPLVTRPTSSGTFNPDLRPVVDICQLAVDASGNPLHCDQTAAEIKPGTVLLDLTDEQYHVNWHTDQPPIDMTKFYRIQVRGAPGAHVLGFADIAPVASGSQLQNVNTGQYIGLVAGRTLPINFRIERGAFCTNQADCGEATIGAGGATVITNTGLAGALFPPNALSSDAVVTIEAVTERPCLPIDLLQRGGCYQFTTDPGPTTFNQLVTAGVCVEIAGLTPTEVSMLHLHQLDFIDEQPFVTPLPNVAAHFLTCDEPHPPPPPSALGWLRDAVDLLMPPPLFAAHLGIGGLTGSFSRIGWALPAQMRIRGGDGQTTPAGTAVATPPSVTVKDSSGAPVPGEAVTFTVGSGGGSVTGGAATTDATGVAVVGSWTLGPGAGANTLVATSRGAVGSPITFAATGNVLAPAVRFNGVTLRTNCDASTTPTLDISGAPNGYGGDCVISLYGRGDVDYGQGVVRGSVMNTTTSVLVNVYVDAWIDQGPVSRNIGSSGFLVGPQIGFLQPGAADFIMPITPSNAFTLFGTGTLVPGPATVRLRLVQGTTEFDTFTIPVTLINSPVRIVNFTAPGTLTIGGPPVAFTVTITNETGVTINNVVVGGFVLQTDVRRNAGGGLLVGCGPNPGDLDPGTCTVTTVTNGSLSSDLTLVASNQASGSGTEVAGSAVVWLLIEANPCCIGAYENLYGLFVPVTLVGP